MNKLKQPSRVLPITAIALLWAIAQRSIASEITTMQLIIDAKLSDEPLELDAQLNDAAGAIDLSALEHVANAAEIAYFAETDMNTNIDLTDQIQLVSASLNATDISLEPNQLHIDLKLSVFEQMVDLDVAPVGPSPAEPAPPAATVDPSPAPPAAAPAAGTFGATGMALGVAAVATLTATTIESDANTNDAPVITNVSQTGSVTEDGGATATASGQVVATDADETTDLTYVAVDPINGTFNINPNTGDWTYELDNSQGEVQALAKDEILQETIFVFVKVDDMITEHQTVVITITGTNDAPVFTSETQTGSVTEDGVATATASGQVEAADVDKTAVLTYTALDTAKYGTFTIDDDASGNWTYELNNNKVDVQALHLNETLNEETLTVTVTDEYDATAYQDVAISIIGVNDEPTGEVTISGTPQEDATLEAKHEYLADKDGMENITYQWLRNDSVIPNANADTYELVQADVEKAIKVTVSYNDGGTQESVTSVATEEVTNVNDVGVVSISGTLALDKVLTADVVDEDGMGTGAIIYEWFSDGTLINGADDNTFYLTQDEVRKVMKVTATYQDAYNWDETPSVNTNPQVVAPGMEVWWKSDGGFMVTGNDNPTLSDWKNEINSWLVDDVEIMSLSELTIQPDTIYITHERYMTTHYAYLYYGDPTANEVTYEAGWIWDPVFRWAFMNDGGGDINVSEIEGWELE